MKRRLRKKRRVGEFQKLGFEVLAALRDGLSDADSEAYLDRWIDAVESRGLAFGGGGSRNGTFEGFITRAGRASATAEDRQVLAAVLAADAAVIDHHFGPLVDAWHGWD